MHCQCRKSNQCSTDYFSDFSQFGQKKLFSGKLSFKIIVFAGSQLTILFALFGVALSQYGGFRRNQPTAAARTDQNAEIVRYDNVNKGDGSYSYGYETSNGIAVQEEGYLRNPGVESGIQTVRGSYSYYAPEGQLIQVTYTADENGFQASGDVSRK